MRTTTTVLALGFGAVMAVEIVEEVAGDEAIRIDDHGKADAADREGDMSCSFSVASGFKESSSGIDDLLWTRIDLAER